MKAREWLVRGKQLSDPMDAFSSYWRGFNNLFSTVGVGRERDLIRNYLDVSITLEQAQDVLNENADGIGYLLSVPIIDMRDQKKNTSGNIQMFRDATNAKAKLSELFMIIYQVRCNLEHGQKSPSRDRDMRLCACAAPIVSRVLEFNV